MSSMLSRRVSANRSRTNARRPGGTLFRLLRMPQSMRAAPWRGVVKPLIGPMRLTRGTPGRTRGCTQQREGREAVGAFEQDQLGDRRREAVPEHVGGDRRRRRGRPAGRRRRAVRRSGCAVGRGSTDRRRPTRTGRRGRYDSTRNPAAANSGSMSTKSSFEPVAPGIRTTRGPSTGPNATRASRPLGASNQLRSVPGGSRAPIHVGQGLVERAGVVDPRPDRSIRPSRSVPRSRVDAGTRRAPRRMPPRRHHTAARAAASEHRAAPSGALRLEHGNRCADP